MTTPSNVVPLPLQVKIGSALVQHADEFMSDNGHPFDLSAFRSLIENPEVAAWLAGLRAAALLPVKR